MRKIDTKEILFWFIGIIAMFLILSVSLNTYGQYPASPSEIGLQGAGVDYSNLEVRANAGRVVLSSGVHENIDWQNAYIVVTGTDVVIRKCRLLWNGEGYFAIKCTNPGANLIIEDCEIDGQGNSSSNGIAFTGYSLIRTWVHNIGADGLKANGAVTVYRSWIGPLNPLGSDPHCDVVQVLKNEGAPIIFSCSVFEGHLEPGNPYYEEWNGNTNVNCLRFSGEQGPVGDVVIVGNHFMGSGFQLSMDARVECSYKVENNMFDTDFNHGYYYPTSTPANIIWSNNENSDGGQVPLINTGENTASYGTVPNISYPYYDGQSGTTPPSLSSIADQTMDEGAVLNVSVSATDNDGDAITLTAPSKPSFASFTDNGNGSGTLTLSPQTGDEGIYSITIQASATDGSDQETFSITVNAASVPPNGTYYCDPVNGSMSNSGSLSSPWGSLEDVFADGKTFAAGDIIYLMSGDHGAPYITASNTSDVTITKYGSDSPVLECIKFNGASHWMVKDVKINPEIPFPNQNVPNNHPVYPLFANSMIQVEGSSDITIENCSAISYNNSSSWTVDDWRYKAWNGVFIQNGSDNITVTNCYFKNVNFGYKATTNCSNLTIEYSTIENFSGDGIRPDCDYTVVQYNTVMNCYDINGNHDDLLQVYSSNNVTGIVIRGNTFIDHIDPNQPHLYDGDGNRAQGIALFDGLYIDFVVENNLVVTDHWHGLSMYGAVNSKIVNNTVVDLNNINPGPAWIKIPDTYGGTACTGNLVRNNLSVKMEVSSNVGTVDNNMVISWSEYSTYFNDYANFDYTLASNSPAIDAGSSVQAPATDMLGVTRPQGSAVDIGCYEYTTSIIPVDSVAVSPQSLSLEVGNSSTLNKTVYPLNATNKSVQWSSSAPSIADVDANGVVSALSGGQTTITVTTNDGGFTAQCIVSVSPAGTTPENVALNKSVTASAENLPDDPVTELVDGDPIDGNRWSAPGFPQWAEIDLGSYFELSSVELVTFQGRDYQYIIEASLDGNSFTTIVDRSANCEGTNLVDAVDIIARFVKITVSGACTYTGTWTSLNELSVYGIPAVITEPSSISVNPDVLNLNLGETAQITETVLPEDAGDKSVTWSTSDASVATVDATGLVTAAGGGSATITAQTVNGLTATCNVNVTVLPTSISVAPETVDLIVGGTQVIQETVLPGDATDKTVTWSSSNTSVATVDNNGLVTAISSGNATITATTVNSLVASCAVSVSQPPTSISVDPTVLNLIVGGSGQITETVLPTDADDKTVSWSSDNSAIASVDASGVVSGLSVGQTTITATTNTGGLTAQCSVTVAQPATGYIIDEDFSSGASDFTVVAGGTWAVSGGRYVLSSPASGANGFLGNISVHNTAVTGDFELSTLLNITGTTSTWNDAAVIFNYQDINNYYYVILNESNDQNTKGIFKIENGSSSELVDITTNILDDTDYLLEISKTGSDIVVKLDGAQIASATDATFTGGQVGYGTKNDGAQYDDLLVAVGVILPESITLNNSSADLEPGESLTLVETVLPEEATDKSVTWTSSDASIASVLDGVVSAISEGTATITATTVNNLTATCTITVQEAEAWSILTYDDFEAGWGNFKDGGGDCILYTGGTYAHQGSNAAQIQDNQGEYSDCPYNSSVDLTSYSQLKVEFWFYGLGMEVSEDFFVEYSDDGGTTWQIVAAYVSGTDFNNDAFYSVMDDGDIPAVVIDNSSYSFSSNAMIRFRCDGSQNDDQIYIDEVTVSVLGSPAKSIEAKNNTPDNMSGMLVYPNPNPGDNVLIALPAIVEDAYINIYDINGKQVLKQAVNGEQSISINLSNNSTLKKGMYIIEVSTRTSREVSKLIVK